MINQNNLPFKTKLTGIIFFMISLEIYIIKKSEQQLKVLREIVIDFLVSSI